MNTNDNLPEFVTRLQHGETFRFDCHPKVSCFTHCCRMLDLALTPYDLLRLRLATGLTSQQLLDQYVILEQDPGEPFPRFYLTMVDDGQASCIFVGEDGCTIYDHRPSACRTYPLGRAVIRQKDDTLEEHYVLLKEKHCHGFTEQHQQNIARYTKNQQLAPYNEFNDLLASILQHDAIRQGFIPSAGQIELFTLAFYNLDTFRQALARGELQRFSPPPITDAVSSNDELLLRYGMELVFRELYSPFSR